MAINECIPYYEDGEKITGSVDAGQTVTGKRFVKSVGVQAGGPGYSGGPSQFPGLAPDNVAQAGGNIIIRTASANGAALGVADIDGAAGAKVGIFGPGHVVPVTADGAITAGDLIMVGASGKAKTYAPPALSGNAENLAVVAIVGYACSGAADGADCAVRIGV
jgi:hypothetical protein